MYTILFVSCHKPFPVPEHPLLAPIQVGAALSEVRLPGYLQDDAGDNISAKNPFYCELTAQYWAWKNVQADYYGFFHYRRYLYPDIDAQSPYCVAREPTPALLKRLGYAEFEGLIEKYDLIAPVGENMYVSVREHYASAPFHHQRDLAIAEEIIKARHPEMRETLEDYFSQSICYFGNMFIMRRTVFQEYCAWLFPILKEFDLRADTSGYTAQERRVDGYLAERLFGLYYSYQVDCGTLRTVNLPRVHFVPERIACVKQSLLSAALPPGSRRRSLIKRLMRRKCGCPRYRW